MDENPSIPTLLYILLHSITFYYILLHSITFYYILLHSITFYYILLHFITFSYILLHFITFYYILLHFITFLRAFSGSRLPQCARLKPFPSHQFRSHQNVKAALTTKPWTSQQLDPFCACS